MCVAAMINSILTSAALSLPAFACRGGWTVIRCRVASADGRLERIARNKVRMKHADQVLYLAEMSVAALLSAPTGIASEHIEGFHERGEGHRGIDIALRHVHAHAFGDQGHANHHQEGEG